MRNKTKEWWVVEQQTTRKKCAAVEKKCTHSPTRNHITQRKRYSKVNEPVARHLTWHNEKRFAKIHIYILEQWKSSPQNRAHKSSSSYSIAFEKERKKYFAFFFHCVFFRLSTFFFSPVCSFALPVQSLLACANVNVTANDQNESKFKTKVYR